MPWTMLYVEDDRPEREAVREDFLEWGWSVITARTAEEAVAALKSAHGAIDVVLVDIGLMGPISGIDLARHCEAKMREYFRVGAFYSIEDPNASPRLRELSEDALLRRWRIIMKSSFDHDDLKRRLHEALADPVDQ